MKTFSVFPKTDSSPLTEPHGPLANGHGTPSMRPLTSRLSQRVLAVPPSGIRKYFDIAATMEDVVSLGIGEPDFVTPPPILQAGIQSLQRGRTSYTSNSGLYELRKAVVENLQRRYGAAAYDPEKEALITAVSYTHLTLPTTPYV